MTETERYELFFYFLRMGLYGGKETYVGARPMQEDWKWMIEQAHWQAVTGPIIDGIANSAMRPDELLWEQWIFYQLRLEEMNKLIADCGKRWLQQLEQRGIRAFVFKGTAVAAYYPEPLHRNVGDVDLVVQEGWEELESLLANNGWNYQNEHGDLILEDNGMRVELHQQCEFVFEPLTNARLQRWLRRNDNMEREMELICLIMHLRRHFLTYGVGLKQVCDVAMILRNGHMDKNRVRSLIQKLHAATFCRVLFGFIAECLDVTLDFPLQPIRSGKNLELFREVIWKEGYSKKLQREEQAYMNRVPMVRVLKNMGFWVRRSFRLFWLMPGETVGFLTYMWWRRVKKIFHVD